MEEHPGKLGFVQTFPIPHRFLFLPFFSSVSLLYVSATALKKRPCCKLPCLLFDTSLTCEGKSLSTFWSFPTWVCQLKFAVWRPLNIFYCEVEFSLRSKRFYAVREQRITGRWMEWVKEGDGKGEGRKEGNACRQTPGFWKPPRRKQRCLAVINKPISETLDCLRNRRHCQKVATNISQVQPHNLPLISPQQPITVSRVYFQVQQWEGVDETMSTKE